MLDDCKKTLFLSSKQKGKLEAIQRQVKENGGSISVMRLMQDAITIFLEHYKDEAIEKYSPNYKKVE